MTDEEFVALQKEKKRKRLSNFRKKSNAKKQKEKIKEKVKKKVEEKVAKELAKAVPAIIVKEPTIEEVESALKKHSGLISYTAKELQCPTEIVKKIIKKNKGLRNLLFDLRETIVDIAEDTLLYRMREKQDGIIAMFVAKCLGKQRGWIERPEKAGGSSQKPLYIRILPVDGEIKSPGRPKKMFAEVKVGEALPAPKTKEEKDLQEIIDAEVLDN